jgi:hypothetical protein
MSLRVLLHAEGALETGAAPGFGEVLGEDEHGPAHALVRRVLSTARQVPEAAVRFVRPHKTGRGLTARGSDLLSPRTLRQLLAWLPAKAPSVAVVLVDADGHPHRAAEVMRAAEGAMVRPVVAVAVQEFEAWLIANEAAASATLGRTFERQPDPERMRPGDAKRVLVAAIGAAGADGASVRKTLATTCDLAVVARRCPSFARFRDDLRAPA